MQRRKRKRRSSNGYQADSGADSRADSAIASEDYRSETARPDASADEGASNSGLELLESTWKSMKDGWWNQAGFDTFYDYVKHSDAQWERMGFRNYVRNRPRPRDLPSPAPPEIDVDEVASDAIRARGPRQRQVNIRLTELGYDALRQAARGYGLTPSTLARLLVHRGAIAVIETQMSGSSSGPD